MFNNTSMQEYYLIGFLPAAKKKKKYLGSCMEILSDFFIAARKNKLSIGSLFFITGGGVRTVTSENKITCWWSDIVHVRRNPSLHDADVRLPQAMPSIAKHQQQPSHQQLVPSCRHMKEFLAGEEGRIQAKQSLLVPAYQPTMDVIIIARHA